VGVNKLSIFTPVWLAEASLLLGGIVAIILVVRYIIIHKTYEQFIFWPLITYAAIIFLWPFYDARFFIPIIPFLMIVFVNTIVEAKAKYLKLLAVPFVLFGIVSVIYTVQISLNKDYFIEKYGNNQELRESYFRFKNGITPAKADTSLYLLQQYD
jgi:uncharacterized membrane protein (DUF373 family)